MEEGSFSAIEEISNNDFIFGSFNQDYDLKTVFVIPTISTKQEIEGCSVKIGEINCFLAPLFLNLEVKDEEKFQNIVTGESKPFDFKCEIDFLVFKNILPTLPDSVSTSHTESVFASDLFHHHLFLELGNLPLPAALSLLAVVFATPSELASLTFDPGGASKHIAYTTKDYAKFFSNFPAALSLSKVTVLVSFPSCPNAFTLNFSDLQHLALAPPNAVARHHDFIFNPSKPAPMSDCIQFSLFPSSTVLISVKPEEHLILIFDSGGNSIIFSVRFFSTLFSFRLAVACALGFFA